MAADLVKYGYALLDDSGKTVCIDNIDRAFCKSHKFKCPCCKKDMYATFGETQMPHFRHNGDKCGYLNYLHDLAEQIFFEEFQSCLENHTPFELELQIPKKCDPKCTRIQSICRRRYKYYTIDLAEKFTKVSRETRVNVGEHFRRPDVLLESESGEQLWVEMWVSHETEEEKRKDGSILELKISAEKDLDKIREHSLSQSKDTGVEVRLFGSILPEQVVCDSPDYTPIRTVTSYHRPVQRITKSEKSTEIITSDTIEWVDLGLPSGTLWAKENSGKMSYYSASRTFQESLPSINQAAELRNNCSKAWDNTEKALVLTGPNGNSLRFHCQKDNESYWLNAKLPADNWRWSSYQDAQCFHIGPDRHFWINNKECSSILNVRLVKKA